MMVNVKRVGELVNIVVYSIAIAIVYGAIWFTNLLGLQRVHRMGEKAGTLLYYFIPKIRKKILFNLQFAFNDEISLQDRGTIGKAVVKNLTKNWAELLCAAGPSKEKLCSTICIEGRENLDMALSQGRGAIAISAHIGNYPLMGLKLLQEGYSFTVVVRDFKSRIWSAIYKRSRELLGINSLLTRPKLAFYQRATNMLKNNSILCLITDENKRYGGIFVDFFGRKASTAPGPAALALRTGAPLVPVFIWRNSDNTHTIVIERAIEWKATGNVRQDMCAITSKFTAIIEQYIKKDPSQWVWTNWRWRTQPEGKLAEARIKKKKKLVRSFLKNMDKILKKAGTFLW